MNTAYHPQANVMLERIQVGERVETISGDSLKPQLGPSGRVSASTLEAAAGSVALSLSAAKPREPKGLVNCP